MTTRAGSAGLRRTAEDHGTSSRSMRLAIQVLPWHRIPAEIPRSNLHQITMETSLPYLDTFSRAAACHAADSPTPTTARCCECRASARRTCSSPIRRCIARPRRRRTRQLSASARCDQRVRRPADDDGTRARDHPRRSGARRVMRARADWVAAWSDGGVALALCPACRRGEVELRNAVRGRCSVSRGARSPMRTVG